LFDRFSQGSSVRAGLATFATAGLRDGISSGFCAGKERPRLFPVFHPLYPLINSAPRQTIERSSAPRPILFPESMIHSLRMHELHDIAKFAVRAKSGSVPDTFVQSCDSLPRMISMRYRLIISVRDRTIERISVPDQIQTARSMIQSLRMHELHGRAKCASRAKSVLRTDTSAGKCAFLGRMDATDVSGQVLGSRARTRSTVRSDPSPWPSSPHGGRGNRPLNSQRPTNNPLRPAYSICFHLFPPTGLGKGGKWVETFHLFPPVSTFFHLFAPVSTLKYFLRGTLL